MRAEGKEDCNWCSVAELGMRRGEEGVMKVFSWLSCFLSRHVPSECLLVLNPGIMEWVAGRKDGEEDLSDPLGMESERKGRLLVFCY